MTPFTTGDGGILGIPDDAHHLAAFEAVNGQLGATLSHNGSRCPTQRSEANEILGSASGDFM